MRRVMSRSTLAAGIFGLAFFGLCDLAAGLNRSGWIGWAFVGVLIGIQSWMWGKQEGLYK